MLGSGSEVPGEISVWGMDVWQKRRLRRITEAVYHAASPPPAQTPPPVKHRFLPSAQAMGALLGVVALIVVVSLVKWAREPDLLPSTVGETTHTSSTTSLNSEESGLVALPESGVTPAGELLSQQGTETGGMSVMVYVSGCVNTPGVVTLPEGSRVIDALEAAGGATGEADLSAINLARKVGDGEHIEVTRPGEAPHSAQATGEKGSLGRDGAATSCVDINTADQTALEQLDGVGPALAQRIITYREQVGHIQSVEQLDDVSGIGPALLARIAPGVCP